MADLGRVGEALEWAWAEYCAHPDRFSFDRLMAFVPAAASPAWREKAVVAALDTGGLRPLVELLVHTGETERLADLIGQSPYSAVQGLSHYMAEPAGGASNRGTRWRRLGPGGRRGCVSSPGGRARSTRPRSTTSDVPSAATRGQTGSASGGKPSHRYIPSRWRKGRFMPRFQTLVQDADTERHPSFLERARSRWALPDPDQS